MLMFLLTTLLWANSPKTPEACAHGSDRFNCVQFIRIIDGDTFVVDLPGIHSYFGSKAHVRVYGIDTPEKGKKAKSGCEQKLARIATKLTESELRHAKRIDLQLLPNANGKLKLDKYGRILAKVLYDGKDLAAILIKNQLAVEYQGEMKPKTNWCSVGAKYLK